MATQLKKQRTSYTTAQGEMERRQQIGTAIFLKFSLVAFARTAKVTMKTRLCSRFILLAFWSGPKQCNFFMMFFFLNI